MTVAIDAAYVDYLIGLAIESTPGDIPDDVIALLPDAITYVLEHLDDLDPLCCCSDCIVGLAGDRIHEVTGDPTWGFSR